MRSFIAVVLATITSTFAYQVTAPGNNQNWTITGPNTLTWVRVDTDPLNFTAVLTNQNLQTAQVLNALVDGTMGTIVCNPPSGGWPQGSGFRVNLAADAQHLDTLLAQSNQFSITSGNSSAGSSTGSNSFTSYASTATTGASATSGASSTSSNTNTTPTTNAGAGMNVETGFLTVVVALAAFVTTQF